MVLAGKSGVAFALAAISIAAGAVGIDTAFAAQGPGTAAGTASDVAFRTWGEPASPRCTVLRARWC